MVCTLLEILQLDNTRVPTNGNGTNVFAIDMLNTASADGYSLTTPNYTNLTTYNMSGTILFDTINNNGL